MKLSIENAGKAARAYRNTFGDPADYDRFIEIADLVAECETMDDVEELADCEDGTISYGELSAISNYIES